MKIPFKSYSMKFMSLMNLTLLSSHLLSKNLKLKNIKQYSKLYYMVVKHGLFKFRVEFRLRVFEAPQ